MPEGVGYGPQDTASVGVNLNVIGNHAYGYSGLKALSSSAANHLDFQTGNFVFKGRIYFNGGATEGSAAGGSSTCKLILNGVAIAIMRVLTSADDQPSTVYNDVIIPPYTEFQARVDSVSSETEFSSLLLVGRIYK